MHLAALGLSNVSPDVPPGVPSNVSPNVQPRVLSNVPPDVPPGVPSDVPQNVQPRVPSNVPQNVQPRVPSNVPQNVQPRIPSNVPPDVPPGVPSDVPPNVPPNVQPDVQMDVPPNGQQGVPLNVQQGVVNPTFDQWAYGMPWMPFSHNGPYFNGMNGMGFPNTGSYGYPLQNPMLGHGPQGYPTPYFHGQPWSSAQQGLATAGIGQQHLPPPTPGLSAYPLPSVTPSQVQESEEESNNADMAGPST